MNAARTLPAGETFADTTGSRYRVIRRYDNSPRRLGGGHPDRGYVATALPGSRLTLSGSVYHVPDCRVRQ